MGTPSPVVQVKPHVETPTIYPPTPSTTSTDMAKDYEAIQPYIRQVLASDPIKQISTTPAGLPVFQSIAKINGQEVLVNAITMADGFIQVIDAWVNTK